MQSINLAVGDAIKGRCTKCRKNTDHLILTLADENPAEVQCDACGRRHKYRPPTLAKPPATRRGGDPQESERKEWESLRPSMNSAVARDYSMTDAYKVKALINHPIFGLGLVQRVVGTRKVEVLFEDGRKTMRGK
jgi:hypothetical protein